MDLEGTAEIPASRSAVWAALNDPDVLRAAIPGCERIRQISETELEAEVVAKVGPVKAKFKGKVTLSDLDPPNSYVISGEGTGGAAGFAKGSAQVTLEDAGDGTLLRYSVNAHVGGKLAQIGSRLVDGAARKLARDFFEAFAEILGPDLPATSNEELEAVAMETDRISLSVWIWAGATLALAVGSLIYFGG